MPDNNMRVVRCDCGDEIRIDMLENPGATLEELHHYVWAIRPDGSRSNLGYCPKRHGMKRAMQLAAETWGRADYFGPKVNE